MHVWRLICSFVTYVSGHSASKFIWFFLDVRACTSCIFQKTRSLNQRFWWAMQTSSEAMDPHNARRAVATHSRCSTSGRRTLTLGVVGVWYMFMYIWRAFIYLSCIKLKQWFQFPQVLRPFHMFLPALYKWLKHILSLACTNCGLTSLFYI